MIIAALVVFIPAVASVRVSARVVLIGAIRGVNVALLHGAVLVVRERHALRPAD